MIRLVTLLLIATIPAFCDSASQAWDVAASMASALAEDNAASFEKSLSKQMQGREQLIANVRGLLAQADAISSITLIQQDGDDDTRTLVLDWSLRLKQKGPEIRAEERREAVTLNLVREGKQWRVTALSPLALFTPPEFR